MYHYSLDLCRYLSSAKVVTPTFKTALSFNCQLGNQYSLIMCMRPKRFLWSLSIMKIFWSKFPTRAFISVNDNLPIVCMEEFTVILTLVDKLVDATTKL